MKLRKANIKQHLPQSERLCLAGWLAANYPDALIWIIVRSPRPDAEVVPTALIEN